MGKKNKELEVKWEKDGHTSQTGEKLEEKSPKHYPWKKGKEARENDVRIYRNNKPEKHVSKRNTLFSKKQPARR